jgi:hypothetical protein
MTKQTILKQTFGEEKEEWKKHLLPEQNDLKRFMDDESPIYTLMALMDLPHIEIRNILIEMLPSKYYDILANGHCSKEYSNDKPKEVKFSDYDSITVSWTGITYKPEHGEGENLINGFTIAAILKHFSH